MYLFLIHDFVTCKNIFGGSSMIKFTLRRKKEIKSSDGGNVQNQPNNAKIVLCEASKLSLEDEFMKYK